MLAPDSTLCLINFSKDIYDITGQSTISNYGVSLSSDHTKYNSNSGLFNSSNGNAITITLQEEAKTIMIWFYSTSINTSGLYPTLWSSRSSVDAGGTYTHIDDGSYGQYPIYRVNTSGINSNNGTAGSILITSNEWHHFAYCTDGGGNHYFFLDGILQATISQSSPNTLDIFTVGALMNSDVSFVNNCYFSGYIGEVIALSECLYTSNFTIPTEAYTWNSDVEIDIPLSMSSSSSYGNYSGTIANVIDGNSSTYWWTNSAQSKSAFIEFKFNKPIIFKGLTAITLNNTGDCISSGTVLQVSTNGNDLTTVGQFTGEAECTIDGLFIHNILNVRIYVETSSNKWLCINEITLDYIEQLPIYIKLDSTWNYIDAIYKKVDGVWEKQSSINELTKSRVVYIKGN